MTIFLNYTKFFSLILFFIGISVFSNETYKIDFEKEQYKKLTNAVLPFIKNIKNNDIKRISSLVHYPIVREHPIPPIKNSNEFILRFNEIFDENFIKIISKSDIN